MEKHDRAARIRAWWLGLLIAAGGAQAAPREWTAGNAILELRPNHGLLEERGLSLRVAGESGADALILRMDGTLRYVRSRGNLRAMNDSRWQGTRPLELRFAGRAMTLAKWRAVPAADRVTLDIVDGAGRVWLHLTHPHFDVDRSAWRFALADMELSAGPALAAWTGGAIEAGLALGSAWVDAAVQSSGSGGNIPKACQNPHWPNEQGFTGDVALTEINNLVAQCSGPCNGSAPVKITPSVKLRNVGSADMPWYEKFTVSPYPYPYPGNDQHPFLVWNVYRQDADGALVQIARSGLKHGFATQNTGASCSCPDNHVLAPNCEDEYSSGTNDWVATLDRRAHVIPYTGRWGRCGSTFDPDCNSQPNAPTTGPFELRAVVREADLVATNPPASYFIEAWYVVRDDANIYNGMGHRPFTPTFNGNAWVVPMGTGGSGPVIDRWVDPVTPPSGHANFELATGEGRLKLALRTQLLQDGTTRFTYALMNLDYSRPTTSGSEPNLRVLTNPGIAALRIPRNPDADISSIEFRDGDAVTANDWVGVVEADAVVFTAPAGNTLDWGSMYTFGFIADGLPIAGAAALTPGGVGEPSTYSIATLRPGAPDRLFADGLESP